MRKVKPVHAREFGRGAKKSHLHQEESFKHNVITDAVVGKTHGMLWKIADAVAKRRGY